MGATSVEPWVQVPAGSLASVWSWPSAMACSPTRSSAVNCPTHHQQEKVTRKHPKRDEVACPIHGSEAGCESAAPQHRSTADRHIVGDGTEDIKVGNALSSQAETTPLRPATPRKMHNPAPVAGTGTLAPVIPANALPGSPRSCRRDLGQPWHSHSSLAAPMPMLRKAVVQDASPCIVDLGRRP